MTRFLTIVGLMLSITTFAPADEVVFHRTQLVDGKNHETHADLIFSPSTRMLSLRVAGRVLAEVPYDHIDKISYE